MGSSKNDRIVSIQSTKPGMSTLLQQPPAESGQTAAQTERGERERTKKERMNKRENNNDATHTGNRQV